MNDEKLSLKYIAVDQIKPNPNQPRKHFEPKQLEELADSIDKNGLLHPIVVRPVEDHFEIIAGERRFRAVRDILNKQRVRCVINETVDQNQSAHMALVENLQRENLLPLEEAEAMQQIMDTQGISVGDLATLLGRSRANITNTLRILNLDQATKTVAKDGDLSLTHLTTLVAVKDVDKRVELAEKVKNEGLTVQGLQTEIDKAKASPAKEARSAVKERREEKAVGNKATKLKGFILIKVDENDFEEHLTALIDNGYHCWTEQDILSTLSVNFVNK